MSWKASRSRLPHFDGKDVINLSSNNYLGLTTHKTLKRAAIEAIRTHGVGAGAVRTIAGTMDLHVALEEQIAKFKGTPAAVVFQSGFTANAGTVAAILGKDDLIISDELESRLDHRWLPPFPRNDQSFQAPGCRRLRTRLQGNGKLARAQIADYGRRVFHGRGHCAPAGAVRARGKI